MVPDDEKERQENSAELQGEAEDSLQALQAEMAELKDRMLRALAEAENTRKRAERERADALSYGTTKFARDMLTVADNLRRALDHLAPETRAKANEAVKSVLEGVEATERELQATLARHGIRRIDAEGARFDPHLHQAIAEVPAEGKEAGTVVSVIQEGYTIADRLLRPAMVTVARAETVANSAGEPEEGAL
ncbi:MAG: nucleotide exchange factor GrpE [Alphaproteobacteria bacterium]